MPVKKEREYRTLVAPLVAQSSGEKRIQSECYVEGYATIAACKMDLQDVGVKKLDETDALIIRAITLYCKAEFGYSDKSEQFWKSYECLKTHLSLSSEYTGGETPDSTDDEVNEEDIKNLFG